MKLVQEKLEECVNKQSTSMEGLTRLSKQLGNDELPEPQDFDDVNKSNTMVVDDGEGVVDALETTTARVGDLKGENKAPKRKHRRGKKYSYMLRAKGEQKKPHKEKPKPKYFCQF